VLLFVGLALLAPLASPYDPNFQHPAGLSQFGQAQLASSGLDRPAEDGD
jgi:hypothetical protein